MCFDSGCQLLMMFQNDTDHASGVQPDQHSASRILRPEAPGNTSMSSIASLTETSSILSPTTVGSNDFSQSQASIDHGNDNDHT